MVIFAESIIRQDAACKFSKQQVVAPTLVNSWAMGSTARGAELQLRVQDLDPSPEDDSSARTPGPSAPPSSSSSWATPSPRLQSHRSGSAFVKVDELDRNFTGAPISLLGPDQLGLILQLLPVRSILSFGLTCRKGREAVEADSIWSTVCLREWGPEAAEAEVLARRVAGGWKQIYREMTTLEAVSWQQVAISEYGPGRRASFTLSQVSDRLVIFAGGADGGRHLDDTWTADPTPLLLPGGPLADGLSWQQSATGLPPGRFGYSATVLPGGNKILIFGGITDLGQRLTDVWIAEVPPPARSYISDVNTPPSIGGLASSTVGCPVVWKELELRGGPQARGAHAGCYAGGMKVVINGGIALDTSRLPDTWILDLESPVEEERLRGGDNGAPNNGEGSGWDKEEEGVVPERRDGGGEGSSGKEAERVVLSQPRWTCIATGGPAARSGHTMTWLGDGKIIMFGGRNGKFEILSDVWLLDLSQPTPVWCELWSPERYPEDESPGARTGHSATAIFGQRVLIIGGEDGNRKRRSDVWVMDPGALGVFRDNRSGGCGAYGPPGPWEEEDQLEGLLDSVPSQESEGEAGVVPAAGGWKRPPRKMWRKLTNLGGMPFKKRSFHGACRVGGAAVALYGGMVDGELVPKDGGGLKFDDDMWLLQLVRF